jgi:hypothetical protein
MEQETVGLLKPSSDQPGDFGAVSNNAFGGGQKLFDFNCHCLQKV